MEKLARIGKVRKDYDLVNSSSLSFESSGKQSSSPQIRLRPIEYKSFVHDIISPIKMSRILIYIL